MKNNGFNIQNNINYGITANVNHSLEKDGFDIRLRHLASNNLPDDNFKQGLNMKPKAEDNNIEWDRMYSAYVASQYNSRQFSNFPISQDNDSIQTYNSSAKKSGYKPYTLKEYKESRETQSKASTQVGGLGPNIGGEEWLKKKEKLDKMNEFAINVKLLHMQNAQKLPPSHLRKPKAEDVSKSKRDIATEFGKKT